MACSNMEFVPDTATSHKHTTTFSLNEIAGKLPLTEKFIAHCVSSDLYMGGGFAKEIREKFGCQRKFAFTVPVGNVFVNPSGEQVIFNLVTKVRYFHKPTFYTLTQSLLSLRKAVDMYTIERIALPRIGCGLDRLVWSQVRQLIINIFKDTNIQFDVYVSDEIALYQEQRNSRTTRCHIKTDPAMNLIEREEGLQKVQEFINNNPVTLKDSPKKPKISKPKHQSAPRWTEETVFSHTKTQTSAPSRINTNFNYNLYRLTPTIDYVEDPLEEAFDYDQFRSFNYFDYFIEDDDHSIIGEVYPPEATEFIKESLKKLEKPEEIDWDKESLANQLFINPDLVIEVIYSRPKQNQKKNIIKIQPDTYVTDFSPLFKRPQKYGKVRFFCSKNNIRAIFRSTRSKRPNPQGITNFQIQSLTTDGITRTLCEAFSKLSIGKNIKTYLWVKIAGNIINIIIFIYNMIANKSKIGLTVNAIGIATSLASLIADIYFQCYLSPSTVKKYMPNSDEIVAHVTHFMQEQEIIEQPTTESRLTVMDALDLDNTDQVTKFLDVDLDVMNKMSGNQEGECITTMNQEGYNLLTLQKDIEQYICTYPDATISRSMDTIIRKITSIEYINSAFYAFDSLENQKEIYLHSLFMDCYGISTFDFLNLHKDSISLLIENSYTQSSTPKYVTEYLDLIKWNRETEDITTLLLPKINCPRFPELTAGFLSWLLQIDVKYLDKNSPHVSKINEETFTGNIFNSKLEKVIISNTLLNVPIYVKGKLISKIEDLKQCFIRLICMYQAEARNCVDDDYTRNILNKMSVFIQHTFNNFTLNIKLFEQQKISPDNKSQSVSSNYDTVYTSIDETLSSDLNPPTIVRSCSLPNIHSSKPVSSVIQPQSQNYVEMAIKYSLVLVGSIFAIIDMQKLGQLKTKNTWGENLTIARRNKASVIETIKDMESLVHEISFDVFGATFNPIKKSLLMMEEEYNRMLVYSRKPLSYYMNDFKEFYNAKTLLQTTERTMIQLSHKSNDLTAGYQNLRTLMANEIITLKTLLDNVANSFKNQVGRIETRAFYIYGARGAGKTHFVNRYLIPKIIEANKYSPLSYNLNFSGSNFFPEYLGQEVMLYDEFLANRVDDPIIPFFNAIHSMTSFNMEGAALHEKTQPCALRAAFYVSNQPHVELETKMSAEAASGFYSRLFPIHFVNVKQEVNTPRDNIEHDPEFNRHTYELRWYQGVIDKTHNYSMIDVPTPNKDDHYDEEADAYDDTLYQKGPLKYKLLTNQQLVTKINAILARAEVLGKENSNENLKKLILSFLSKCSQRPSNKDLYLNFQTQADATTIDNVIKDHLVTMSQKMAPTVYSEYCRTANIPAIYFTPLDVQGENLDHFVVYLNGPPGSGKTHMSRQIAQELSKYYKMPVLEFNTLSQDVSKTVKVPSIIVLNDVYDELNYINFYDTIPYPSIILFTSNLETTSSLVKTQGVSEGNNSDVMTSGNPIVERSYFNPARYLRGQYYQMSTEEDGELSYVARAKHLVEQQMVNLIQKHSEKIMTINNPGRPSILPEQPGFIRRLGIPGKLSYGGSTSVRPPTSCRNFIFIRDGYRCFVPEYKGNGKMFYKQEVHKSDIIKSIMTGYEDYTKILTNIPIVKIDDSFTPPSEVDVLVKASTIEELIELTNSPTDLFAKVLMPKKNDTGVVKISQRVQDCPFPYSPLTFAIPKNVTVCEATEVGMKMYRQLILGNASFTVQVSCKSFDIYGLNGTIYYRLKETGAPLENKLSFRETDSETITFTVHENSNGDTQVSDILTMKLDELACMVERSFQITRFQELGLSDTYIQMIMSSWMTIKDFGPLQPYRNKWKFRKITISNAIAEKSQFIKLWLMFKESSWIFKLIVGIGSTLLLGTIVTLLVKAVVSMFTTDVNIHTFKLLDRSSLFPEALEIKVKIDVKKEICLISLPNIYVLDEYCMSQIQTEVLRKMQAQYGIKCWSGWTVETTKYPLTKQMREVVQDMDLVDLSRAIEFCPIQIQSKSGSYDKAVSKQNKSQKNIVELVAHAKQTEYSLKSSKKDKEVQKELVVVPQSATVNPAVKKIYKQLLRVTNTRTGTRLYGYGVYDRYALVPSHVWTKGDNLLIQLCRDQTITCLAKPICMLKGSDVMLVKCEWNYQFKNITNLFIDESEKGKARKIVLYKFGIEVEKGIQTHTYEATYASSEPIVLKWALKADMPNGGKFEYSAPFYYKNMLETQRNLPTQAGDCGLPILEIRGETVKITGNHFGLVGNCSASSCITRDDVQNMLDFDQEVFYDVEPEAGGLSAVSPANVDGMFVDEIVDVMSPNESDVVHVSEWTREFLSQVDEERSYYKCLDGPNLKYHGYTTLGNRSWQMKPKYVPTEWSPHIENTIPNDFSNSAVNIKTVSNPEKLVREEDLPPSILMTQVNKFNESLSANPLLMTSYQEKAIDILSTEYKAIYGQYRIKHLSTIESVNGICLNPNGPLFGQLEGINKHGSTGLEIRSLFPGKSQIKDLLVDSELKGPNNKPLMILNSKPEGKYVAEMAEACYRICCAGHRFEGIVQDNLKVELRKNEKVSVGNTRAFESFPVYEVLAHRRICGNLLAVFKNEREVGHCQIGVDKTDFTQLFQRFQQVGAFGEHGDFSNWDKGIKEEEAMRACKLLIAIANCKAPVEEHDRNARALVAVMKSNIRSISVADGYIYWKKQGNNSGHVLTTVLNCIVNDIRRVACICYLVDKHNLNYKNDDYVQSLLDKFEHHRNGDIAKASLLQNKNVVTYRINLETVLENHDWINYGDDIASITSEEYLWLINFVTLSQGYKELFGIEYTSPHKDGSIEVVTPINELNFISRDFTYNPQLKVVTPTLKMDTIKRLFHWTTEKSHDQYTAIFHDIFAELALYPEEVDNSYRNLFNSFINPMIVANYGKGVKLPNRRVILDDFVETVNSKLMDSNPFIVTDERLYEVRNTEVLDCRTEFLPILTEVHSGEKSLSALAEMTPQKFAERKTEFDGIFGLIDIKVEGIANIVSVNETWSVSTSHLDVSLRPQIQKVLENTPWVLKSDQKIKICIGNNVLTRYQYVLARRPNVREAPIQIRPAFLDTMKNLKIQSEETIMGKGKTESTLLTLDGSKPDNLAFSKDSRNNDESFLQLDCWDKAFRWYKVKGYETGVGSTPGQLVFDIGYGQVENPYMLAIKNLHTYVDPYVDVKIAFSTNAGVSGEVSLGLLKSDIGTPTAADLFDSNIEYIDVAIKSERDIALERCIVDTARTPMIPVDALTKNMYRIGCFVETGIQTTFDNEALKINVSVWSRFNPKTRFALGGLPPTVKDSVSTLVNPIGVRLSNLIGNDQLVLDGPVHADLVCPKLKSSMILQPTIVCRKWSILRGDKDNQVTLNNEFKLADKMKENTDVDYLIQELDLDMDIVAKGSYTFNNAEDLKFKSQTQVIASADGAHVNWSTSHEIDGYLNQPEILGDSSGIAKFTLDIPVDTPKMNFTVAEARFASRYYTRKGMSSSYENCHLEQLIGGDQPKDSHTVFFADNYNVYQKTTRVIKTSQYKDVISFDISGSTISLNACEIELEKPNFNVAAVNTHGGIHATWDSPYNYQLLNSVLIMDQPVNVKLVDVKPITAENVSNLPADSVSLPAGCVQLIQSNLSVIPSVADGAVTRTIFESKNLGAELDKFYHGAGRVMQLTVSDATFKQPVFNFILYPQENGHPSKVFVRLPANASAYQLCNYRPDELIISNINYLEPGAVIPSTNLNNFSDRRSTMYSTKVKSPFKQLVVQGAAASMIGGGALSGIGSGLQGYFQSEKEWKMFTENVELQKYLRQQIGDQAMDQLLLSGEQAMKQIEAQGEIDRDLNQQKAVLDRETKGLASVSMQNQLSRYPGFGDGRTQPAANSQQAANATGGDGLNTVNDYLNSLKNTPSENSYVTAPSTVGTYGSARSNEFLSAHSDTPSNYQDIPDTLSESSFKSIPEPHPLQVAAAQVADSLYDLNDRTKNALSYKPSVKAPTYEPKPKQYLNPTNIAKKQINLAPLGNRAAQISRPFLGGLGF